MRVKIAIEKIIEFVVEYLKLQNKNIQLKEEWVDTLKSNYDELRSNYKDCFGKKKTHVILDEHKFISCVLISIQITGYPVSSQTQKFRVEQLMLYIMVRSMELLFFELSKNSEDLVYKEISKNISSKNIQAFKFPDVINTGDNNEDYKRQFIKSLYYSFLNKNKDIFNLANIIFLLEQYNYSYYKSKLVNSDT